MPPVDPHSYNDPAQPDVTRLHWRAEVDFASRTLAGEVRLELAREAAGALDLDTRDLVIHEVRTDGGATVPFTVDAADPILGARLRLELPSGTRAVTVRYRTSPTASALQWLDPRQTAGGRHPYLYSQCQAIHARSVLPLQDTPRLRIRYTAELTVPRSLRALMAAAFVSREERDDVAVEKWEMPQPIPPYLLALAVGNLVSRDLGERSRVWAEPEVIERAAWEFAGVGDMVRVAEGLLGPYAWDRFDILTMPPAFPYGGMENPRLTFLTPSLLAGDRSLVNVVAHELAHSWTGNLVTNATAEHFWLNEGFTVFAERRILEALEGTERAALSAALGRRDLDLAVARFDKRPELTRLRTHLQGIDPDDAFSEVPYEKGYLFLRTLEEAAGREAFDRMLRRYLDQYRFQSVTTDDFLAVVERELPGVLGQVKAEQWVDEAGVPVNAPRARSSRLDAVRAFTGQLPDERIARAWSPTEWQLYLETVPRPAPAPLLDELAARFRLGHSTNHDILFAWLELAVASGRSQELPQLDELLGAVGRMKYLRRIYRALAQRGDTRTRARELFERHKGTYHPVAQNVVSWILKEAGV